MPAAQGGHSLTIYNKIEGCPIYIAAWEQRSRKVLQIRKLRPGHLPDLSKASQHPITLDPHKGAVQCGRKGQNTAFNLVSNTGHIRDQQ